MATARAFNLLERIVLDPEIMAGKPVVKGTRVPVERVIQHLADNPDTDDLFQAFPQLTLDDVKACLAFAHEQIERSTHRNIRRVASGRPRA